MGKFLSNQRYIRRQGRLFDRSIEELIAKGYGNKFVAFENGDVLDSDTDTQALAIRVHEKYGWQKPIYIGKVVREKDRVPARMPSPRIRREG